MASYYIMKPVREALFLHSQGYQSVPVVHILVGVAAWIAALAYDRLAGRIRGGRLVILGQPLLAGSIALFWVLLRVVPEGSPLAAGLPWVYYVGVGLFAVFAVALFWSLAHTVFTVEESRKVYGFIGAGGIAGGVAGGWTTGQLVKVIGSENLLLIASGLIFLCWYLAIWLDARRQDDAPQEVHGEARPSTWARIWHDSYITGIAALVFITMVVAELGDNQTQRVLSDAHMSRDQLTAFYGVLYSRINMLGLLISLFLAGPIQTRFGPGPGLILLPLAAIVEAVVMAGHPDPEILSVILIFDLGIQYSIFQSSKELLYNPTDLTVKFQAKTFIDTFGYRLGISFGALVVVLFFRSAELWIMSAWAIALALATCALALWLQRAYRSQVAARL